MKSKQYSAKEITALTKRFMGKWQRRVLLEDWQIEVYEADAAELEKEMGYPVLAVSHATPEYKQARIALAYDRETNERGVELLVLHELFHLLVHDCGAQHDKRALENKLNMRLSHDEFKEATWLLDRYEETLIDRFAAVLGG